MSSTSTGAIAIAIFLLSLWVLVAPLLHVSPWFSAALVTVMAGSVALEQAIWNGRLSCALSSVWQRQSPQYRDRILHHEAGHMLAACVLGIPVTDYVLDPWQALKRGYPGYGGVQLDDSPWERWQAEGQIRRSEVERYGVMWMAGPVAERNRYGQSLGADSDRQQLHSLVAWLNRNDGAPIDPGMLERWCELRAKTLLEERDAAYQVALAAMRDGRPLADCQNAINESLENCSTTAKTQTSDTAEGKN
ncbi:MAG: ATP-dependent Zn protease [Cyanobacteria bacterium P01_D01_bin.123]